MTAVTRRDRQKSDRRTQLLAAAEQLIAERGFLAVRLEDIGAAAGVSGPAIYRHFPNKEALLVELLVGVSTRLLTGGLGVVAAAPDSRAALDGLIEFHLDFALGEPNLIRIQDRDLANLPATAQRQVRRAQRRYVETWVGVLRDLDPGLAEDEARVMAHAAFGLLNSTPHSVPPTAGGVPPGGVPPTAGGVPPTAGGVPPTAGGVPPTAGGRPTTSGRSRKVLKEMTLAALSAGSLHGVRRA